MAEKNNGYRSYHELSPREYMYFPKASMKLGKPGHFSRLELIHISISMMVLTLSFTFALTKSSLFFLFLGHSFQLNQFLQGLGLSFLGIVTAFFSHELSHKLMAQTHGLWSEYRMYPKGLVSALLLSFVTGFVFAAPGAVMFRGEPRPFEEGRIAVAGSLANLFIAGITLPILLYTLFEVQGIFTEIIGFICVINTILAVFNLLPFGPLDGVKIVQWNATIWAVMLTLSVTILAFLFPFITWLLQ